MNIHDVQKKIGPILRSHHIPYAAIFGSVARGEDTSKSDVDILIKPGKSMGMISYVHLVRELEEKLGRKVDVVTDKSVNKYIRPHLAADLTVVYEE